MRVSGFSLIELLVVIGIVALINAIMIPNFSAMMSSAKVMSAKSTTRNLMVAIEQYYFLNQGYPGNNNATIEGIIAELKAENIIQASPINPFTNQAHTSSDTSGKLIYRRTTSDSYQIQLYGADNMAIIFEYP
ncbi:MAG: type II secretion system protein [Candidatus Marinamargulisbacteria bacterium]